MTNSLLPPSYRVAERLKADASYGVPEALAPDLVRLLAENPKDYTGPGTNTYLVGSERLFVVDPGPVDDGHVTALLDSIAGRPVDGIFVTHTHLDHSPAARVLKAKLGAKTYGMGCVDLELGRASGEDIDLDFVPDHVLVDDEWIDNGETRLQAIHTPGHFPNHLCLSQPSAGRLFTGDHIMGWSTTVVVPPLGHLGDYLASVDKLDALAADVMLPSHGDLIFDPATRVSHLKAHRAARHAQVADCLARGITDPVDIVDMLYDSDLPDRLRHAARGQVQAHMDRLLEETGSDPIKKSA